MNIGFDISALSIPKSGVGNYQVNLLSALLKIDKENFYNLYAFNFRNKKRFKEIKFPSSNYKINISSIPQRLITAWWLMFNFPSLESVVGDCDIYHVSEICIQPTKKAKTVAFVHDLTTLLHSRHHARSNVFAHKMRFKNINKVDAILTNSDYTKGDIIKHLNINPDKIFVTYLGADKRFCPKLKKNIQSILYKYNLNKPYILFVGTLEPRKNVQTLIKAFDELKKKHDLPHQLVLIGRAGWLYEDIFKTIKQSRNKNDIKCLGYVEDKDLPILMNGAKVFVYPSFYEGFGLPILEAMQCGTPVITSNTSSMPEVGGDACLYIEPEDVTGLADQIYRVVYNNELIEDLSQKGIKRAKNFSWDKCARETLKIYESLT